MKEPNCRSTTRSRLLQLVHFISVLDSEETGEERVCSLLTSLIPTVYLGTQVIGMEPQVTRSRYEFVSYIYSSVRVDNLEYNLQ